MNRDRLTLLSCGSLAFMLLAGNSAFASEVPSQSLRTIEFKAPNAQDVQAVNAPAAQENSQSASLDPMSDTVGDLAVTKFGCDCMGCRNQSLSMLLRGNLTQPN